MFLGLTTQEWLTSPLLLALAAFLIVWLRLETAKIQAQLRQLQDRNARNDASNGFAVVPPTPLTQAERKTNGNQNPR